MKLTDRERFVLAACAVYAQTNFKDFCDTFRSENFRNTYEMDGFPPDRPISSQEVTDLFTRLELNHA